MYRVMIRDNMSPVAREILEATDEIEVVVDNDRATADPKVLAGLIGDYDGLAIRSTTAVTADVLERAVRLKAIGRAGIGVDNIDVPAATARGIVVMNAPGGNTVTTAEHAISMMLSLARHIPQGTASVREGKWEKKKFTGVEISGKTLGIVGLGQIGRVVADRAQGLKMKVIAADPFVSREAALALDVELIPLDELLERSDFITLHVPRLKETVNLINREALDRMKAGARIINCSRGDVIDPEALYRSLSEGRIAGAALDVLPKEPPDPALPLLRHPNVIFTPHVGANTGEAQIKVAEMIARQISAYLLNGVILNAVNFPSVSREVMEKLRPYLSLGERMGSLMGQLVRKIHDVTVTYGGDAAGLDTRPITHAVLKGMLASFTDKPVNYVSAPVLAREKGIGVREILSEGKAHYASVVKVRLEGHADGPSEIWGTIFGEYPRLVRLGDIFLDAVPEGSMLVIQNIDRPGVIGNIGTVLGRYNINIGRFQLGRKNGHALCIVNIDSPAPQKVIEAIGALPNIISVRQVRLE